MAPYFDPTTVRQPVAEQGGAAARQILARLDGATQDGSTLDGVTHDVPEHLVLPTELVVRGTTRRLGPST